MPWNTLMGVCRSRKSGRLAKRGKCKAFKRAKVRRAPRSKKGQFLLF